MPNYTRWKQSFLLLGLGVFAAAVEPRCTRLLLTPAQSADRSRPESSAEAPSAEQIKTGMKAHEVKQALGPPHHIVRQILFRRQLAQWAYERPYPLWIEMEQVKGQEAKVIAVHLPSERSK